MAKILNDHDLRAALETLSADRQRVLGAQFAKGVIAYNRDERVARAIETGLNLTATPAEVEDAFKAAKSYATKTYTDCGKDTNWLAQADHFVAAAATAALTPDAFQTDRQNRAWKAAVQARMAVNCAQMEETEGEEGSEANRQYSAAEAFLGSA
jgi:hypothetical protein